MNILIRISIHLRNEYSDTTMADIILNIIRFTRAQFPEMHPWRMDSPVIVTIYRDESLVKP